MDNFKNMRGLVVPLRIRLRNLRPIAVGGLSQLGAYRCDQDKRSPCRRSARLW